MTPYFREPPIDSLNISSHFKRPIFSLLFFFYKYFYVDCYFSYNLKQNKFINILNLNNIKTLMTNCNRNDSQSDLMKSCYLKQLKFREHGQRCSNYTLFSYSFIYIYIYIYIYIERDQKLYLITKTPNSTSPCRMVIDPAMIIDEFCDMSPPRVPLKYNSDAFVL